MSIKTLVVGCACIFSACSVTPKNVSPDAENTKRWLIEALEYGFDMKTTDYTKYMSTDYIEHVNGKTFDFEQWKHHMQGLKDMMQSNRLTFDDIVVEGDKAALSYVVHALKKDGRALDIKIIANFGLLEDKIVSCDELTYVLNGSEE